MTFRQVEKLLNDNGWKCIRIKGSHHQFQKDGGGPIATVPYHSNKDISINVLKSIEKCTGLSLR